MLHRHLARVVLLVALLAPLLGPAPAGAALERQYWGTTTQGGAVVVNGFADGRPARMEAAFRIDCPRQGFSYDGGLQDLIQNMARTPRRFTLHADRDLGVTDGIRTLLIAEVDARRVTPRGRPGSEYWHGTLDVSVRFLDQDDGSARDRCARPRLRWKARREGYGRGRLTLTGDPGEYLTDGRSMAFDTVAAFGDETGISVSEPGGGRGDHWGVRFEPAEGDRLRSGRTYTDADDGPHRLDPEIQVVGPDPFRRCDYPTGEFTIDYVRYDRRGRLRALRARFEHWCRETPQTGLRGTVVFRSRR
jgi:hypothetical protein